MKITFQRTAAAKRLTAYVTTSTGCHNEMTTVGYNAWTKNQKDNAILFLTTGPATFDYQNSCHTDQDKLWLLKQLSRLCDINAQKLAQLNVQLSADELLDVYRDNFTDATQENPES